jgi:nucleoid DNA-binding protein
MSLGKKYIIKNINSKAQISKEASKQLLEEFLYLIKKNSKLNKAVKLSGFGRFTYFTTIKRFGRNPKNLKLYLIPEKQKLRFHTSNIVKNLLN